MRVLIPCFKLAGRMADIWQKFPPVMRHFFYERFREPATWFERRLAYTRSVAVNCMAGELMGRHQVVGHGLHCPLRPFARQVTAALMPTPVTSHRASA